MRFFKVVASDDFIAEVDLITGEAVFCLDFFVEEKGLFINFLGL